MICQTVRLVFHLSYKKDHGDGQGNQGVNNRPLEKYWSSDQENAARLRARQNVVALCIRNHGAVGTYRVNGFPPKGA